MKGNLHISEDDIGSACGFQAIMRYYDSHWVCISWNTVLFIPPCPGVVHWKSPVQLCMSGFWRKNYSKICLKQWGLVWVNTTFSKAFKNPFVKSMVFIFFLSLNFFFFIQAFTSLASAEKRNFNGYLQHKHTLRAWGLIMGLFWMGHPTWKTNQWEKFICVCNFSCSKCSDSPSVWVTVP